jgi:hypothetical protein
MSTVTPRIYTGAFPTISNPLKYALFAASDPLAEVASQTFNAPHPVRAVSFPGLDRINYIFRLYEMSGGLPIRTVINDFNFNPENGDLSYKTPEILVVGETTGLNAGASGFVFDGAGDKPNWIGWNPILQPPGFSPWLLGYDYNWNATTGELELINGVVFENEYRILAEFELSTNSSAGGIPGGRQFTEVLEVTENTTLEAADLGKKILIKPSSNYIKITMPSIGSSVKNRVTWFQTKPDNGTPFCVEIEAEGTSEWAFDKAGRTSMYMVAAESFECYKYDGAWQVQNAVGNFLSVGDQFPSDLTTKVGAILMNGASLNVEQYSRLYNDFVLELDPSQVVSFADWAANPTKWSYANGGGPNLFKCPDRRNLHERNTQNGGVAGVYQPDQLLGHSHFTLSEVDGGNTPPTSTSAIKRIYLDGGNAGYNLRRAGAAPNIGVTSVVGGTENNVKSYRINRFVKI